MLFSARSFTSLGPVIGVSALSGPIKIPLEFPFFFVEPKGRSGCVPLRHSQFGDINLLQLRVTRVRFRWINTSVPSEVSHHDYAREDGVALNPDLGLLDECLCLRINDIAHQ